MWPHESGALSEHTNLGFLPTVAHLDRVLDLLRRTKGRVVIGGRYQRDSRRLEPTVLADVALDDVLMEEYVPVPSGRAEGHQSQGALLSTASHYLRE